MMNHKTHTSNLVHTYVEGNSFPNIFGGHTPSEFGYITHIEHMSDTMQQRWPWLKGKWELSTSQRVVGVFKTLREAKEEALKQWPNCTFKTRKQYSKEPIDFGK